MLLYAQNKYTEPSSQHSSQYLKQYEALCPYYDGEVVCIMYNFE